MDSFSGSIFVEVKAEVSTPIVTYAINYVMYTVATVIYQMFHFLTYIPPQFKNALLVWDAIGNFQLLIAVIYIYM